MAMDSLGRRFPRILMPVLGLALAAPACDVERTSNWLPDLGSGSVETDDERAPAVATEPASRKLRPARSRAAAPVWIELLDAAGRPVALALPLGSAVAWLPQMPASAVVAARSAAGVATVPVDLVAGEGDGIRVVAKTDPDADAAAVAWPVAPRLSAWPALGTRLLRHAIGDFGPERESLELQAVSGERARVGCARIPDGLLYDEAGVALPARFELDPAGGCPLLRRLDPDVPQP